MYVNNEKIKKILETQQMFKYPTIKNGLSHKKAIKTNFAYNLFVCLLEIDKSLKSDVEKLANSFFNIFVKKVKNKEEFENKLNGKVSLLKRILKYSIEYVEENERPYFLIRDSGSYEYRIVENKSEEDIFSKLKNKNIFISKSESVKGGSFSKELLQNAFKVESNAVKLRPVHKFLNNENNGIFVNDLPTGSGKTYLSALLMKQHLIEKNEKKNNFYNW